MLGLRRLRGGGLGTLAVVALAVAVSALLHANGQLFTANPAALPTEADDLDEPALCQGQTPAQVVIDSVVSYPAPEEAATIVLRNIGGQTANLTGWRLTDSDTRDVEAAQNHVFGRAGCEGPGNFTIEPSRTLVLTPKSDANVCGFPFGISFRDEVNLFDPSGKMMATTKWSNSDMGSALKILPDGNYMSLPQTVGVLELMDKAGMFKIFLDLIKQTQVETALAASSDPNYTTPEKPKPKNMKEITPQFPWWFGFGVDRSKLPPPSPPPPPPPPPPKGIPAMGPYTILAPTDDAFESLLRQLGGGRRLPMEQFYKLPELPDIIMYHVLPGRYTTEYMFNNTAIWTAMGVDVVPFNDPCMTEGKIMLHDNCVDKPTPDNYTCDEQKKFDKCYFPFMTSALAAQWQGGFCQRTCERCSCAADSGVQCALILIPDALAANGVVHAISRVLFPPPAFNKSMYNNTIPINITADMVVPTADLASLLGDTSGSSGAPMMATAPAAAPATAPAATAGTPEAPAAASAAPAPEANAGGAAAGGGAGDGSATTKK